MFRFQRKMLNTMTAQLDYIGRCGNGDFIHAVMPVREPRAFAAESHECFGHRSQPFEVIDADQVMLDVGGICQWPKQIKYRTRFQLPPYLGDMAHRRMMARREQKT